MTLAAMFILTKLRKMIELEEMMMKLREKQKAEAIQRMRKLKVVSEAVKQFKEDDVIMVSENGFLYWLDDEQKKIVKDFEEEYDGLVYMVIHNMTEFGELYSMLYVSKHEDEWEYDNEDLEQGYALAYVKNLDDDFCSEFGSIAIKNRFGGIVRVE